MNTQMNQQHLGRSTSHLTCFPLNGVMAFVLLLNQAAFAQSPAGYTKCANEGESFILRAKSHVAYGANGYYVYLFNQTGTVTFNAETFGSDPVFGTYKSGYYKIATGHESATVLSAAIDKIRGHLNGTAVLTAAQINEQTAIIQANIYLVLVAETIICDPFE